MITTLKMQQKISCLPNKRIKYHEWYKRAVLPTLHVLYCADFEQQQRIKRMSRNNETSGVELVVVGVFAFCLAVVAWLMKTFDVEIGRASCRERV